MIRSLQKIARTLPKYPFQSFATTASLHKKSSPALNSKGTHDPSTLFNNDHWKLSSQLLAYKRVDAPAMSQYSSYISSGLNHLSKTDTETATKFFQKAYQLCLKLFGERSKNEAICLSYLAQTFQLEENFERSLNLYNNALNILKEKDIFCPLLMSDIHHNISSVYQMVGSLPKALDHSQTSLEILMEYAPEDNKRFSLVLQSLGKIYFLMGNLTESKDFYKRALEMLPPDQSQENVIERGLLYEKIGCLMEKEGDLEEAINFKKMSLEIYLKTSIQNDNSILFNRYLGLAALYEKSKNYKESLNYLEKTFQLIKKDKKSKEIQHQGPLLIRIGEMHIRLGNTFEAIQTLEEAMKVIDKENEGGNALHKRARRLLNQANLQQRNLEKSSGATKKVDVPQGILLDSTIPGSLEEAAEFQRMGLEFLRELDFEKARHCLIKAMQGFSFLESPDSKTCQNLRELLQHINNKN